MTAFTKKRKHTHSSKSIDASKRRAVLATAGLFGLLVVAFFLRPSGAETFKVSAEAEQGTVTGSAAALTDQTGASSQGAVQFGTGSSSDQCVVPKAQKLQDQDTTDSAEAYWKRPTGGKVVIYFETTTKTIPEHVEYVRKAAEAWSQSPCLELHQVDHCPASVNCIDVVSKNAGGGDTDGEFTGDEDDGDPVRTGGQLVLYTDVMNELDNPNGRLVTTTHEIGHCIGLIHRKSKVDLMNEVTDDSMSPIPDAIDFQNILVIYGTKQ